MSHTNHSKSALSKLSMENLPTEVVLYIFSMLTPRDLCNLSLTCLDWYDFVEDADCVWKSMCLQYCYLPDVKNDIQAGFSWKECCMRSFGRNGVLRKWQQGMFSSPKLFEDLPEDHMCRMDAETWGDILRMELAR